MKLQVPMMGAMDWHSNINEDSKLGYLLPKLQRSWELCQVVELRQQKQSKNVGGKKASQSAIILHYKLRESKDTKPTELKFLKPFTSKL